MKKLLLALAFLLTPSFAWAQCTGVFASGTVCGNPVGPPNIPGPLPLTTFALTPAGVSGDIQENNGSGGLGALHPPGTATTFLNGLGAFATPPTFSSGAPGYVPASGGSSTSLFLNQAGGFSSVPGATTPQIYGASGSIQNTTGTISASSSTLTLTSAIDFANGQGIRINHAGATFTIPQPTSLTVTPTGTAGSTAYQYTIASIDAAGGVGATITAVSTSTGNATLSTTNYNALSWTAAAGATGYVVYGNKSGSLVPYTIVTGTTFRDTGEGQALPSIPDWVPTSAPVASALADWLITTVSSGGGTTTLTLAATATNAVTSGYVIHSDTAALQSAINAAETGSGGTLYIPTGTYPLESLLTINNHIFIRGDGAPGDNGALLNNQLVTTCPTKGTVLCFLGNSSVISATTNSAIQISDLAIVYTRIPLTSTHAVQINGTGTSGTSNSGSIIQRVQITNAYYAIDLENLTWAQVLNNSIYQHWGGGLIINTPLFPSFVQDKVIGNIFSGDGNSNTYNNNCQFGMIVQAGGDINISANKFNGCTVNSNGIFLNGQASGSQNLEPIVISGNSIEGFTNGIQISTANNQEYASQVVITGNQIWANTPIIISSSGSSSGAAAVCGSVSCALLGVSITGNHLNIGVSSSGNAVALDAVTLGSIIGNSVSCTGGCSSGTAMSLDANTSYVTVGPNSYSPGITHTSNSGSNNRINATD